MRRLSKLPVGATNTGWRLLLLRDLAVSGGIQTGPFGSQLKASEYQTAGVPVVMPQNISGGSIDEACVARTSATKAQSLARHRLRAGDVVFSRRGDLAKIAVADSRHTDWICGTGCLRARLDPDRVDSAYLRYYLMQPFPLHWLQSQALGQTLLNLNTTIVGQLPILLPEIQEQRRIAATLATWDEAIEKTERLLAAKRMHAQGLIHEITRSSALQQAITGRLGDFCTLSKGSGLSKEAVQPDGAYACILYGELYTVYGEVVEHVASRTHTKTSVVSRGDEVLIPASTTTTGEDLANATALHEPGVLLGGDINILRPKQPDVYDAEYLAYYLTHAKKREIVRLAQGSTIVHLYGRDIATLTVALPSLRTQRHAAAVLAQARREIDLLMQLKQQYELQRQGLEQRLLTPPDASRAAS